MTPLHCGWPLRADWGSLLVLGYSWDHARCTIPTSCCASSQRAAAAATAWRSRTATLAATHTLSARGIGRCALFAPSHLLGALRKQRTKGAGDRLTEHEGELAQMSLADLARHPRVLALQSS